MNLRVSIETAYTLGWKWEVRVWKFRKKEIPFKQKNNLLGGGGRGILESIEIFFIFWRRFGGFL